MRKKDSTTPRQPTGKRQPPDRPHQAWKRTQGGAQKIIEQMIDNYDAQVGKPDPEDTKRWVKTETRVSRLISRILVEEDNDQALALVALIDMLRTPHKEHLPTEDIAIMAEAYAFRQSLVFANLNTAFQNHATQSDA